MSHFARAEQVDLLQLTDELCEVSNYYMEVVDLKKLILRFTKYEEDFDEFILERVSNEMLEDGRMENESQNELTRIGTDV